MSERRSGRAKGPQARPEAAFKEAALAAAEQVVEQSSQEIGDGSLSPLQVESVAAVCAASLGAREACVAALLSMDLDQAAALSALEALPARSVLRLLRLLNR